jgi:hypothetical protein
MNVERGTSGRLHPKDDNSSNTSSHHRRLPLGRSSQELGQDKEPRTPQFAALGEGLTLCLVAIEG